VLLKLQTKGLLNKDNEAACQLSLHLLTSEGERDDNNNNDDEDDDDDDEDDGGEDKAAEGTTSKGRRKYSLHIRSKKSTKQSLFLVSSANRFEHRHSHTSPNKRASARPFRE